MLEEEDLALDLATAVPRLGGVGVANLSAVGGSRTVFAKSVSGVADLALSRIPVLAFFRVALGPTPLSK